MHLCRTFLSKVLQYNYELLLFWGPGAPFDKWSLNSEYKNRHNREALAAK